MGALRDVEAANEEVRLTRKNYYPELNLVGEYNDNRNLDGTPGPEEDYSVMLKAKYNIFNGFSDKAKERSSAWRYQQALSIRDRVTRQIDEGITTSWNASRLLRDQEMMLRSNVQEAVSAQKGYQDQFNAGQRSLLDVLDSKVEVFNARKRFLDTHYNRLISEYRMLNSMGALLYALRIESPKEWNEGVKNEDL
jgi:adhesin transport system outer membrane protein